MSWTFHTVANEIGGTRYEDISDQLPSIAEWHRARTTRSHPAEGEGLIALDLEVEAQRKPCQATCPPPGGQT